MNRIYVGARLAAKARGISRDVSSPVYEVSNARCRDPSRSILKGDRRLDR